MVREIYHKLIAQEDVRANLIELKKEIKIEENKRALLFAIGSDYSVFRELLRSDDAKIRKNIALIAGELELQQLLPELYKSYEEESQLFVKSSYLTAMSKLNCICYLEDFKRRLHELAQSEADDASKKHVSEEIKELSELILMFEKPKTHLFVGYHTKSDLVLITNRNHKEITLNQIPSGKKKELNAGVYVQTSDLNEILPIRTYSELLFMLTDVKELDSNPDKIAAKLLAGGLMDFMRKRHEGDGAFYFRIEIKSKMPLDKKSVMAKRTASELERQSERNLINTTTNYEFEIRLIEDKLGRFHVLLKLFTLKEERFLYRKNSISVSIHPVNAALVAQLAKSYLAEGAQVLDPFCGVGTMLIERNKIVPANPMYGLDIQSKAITKARENAELAHKLIHFINRDFFDFEHEYLFDEIITNMPSRGGRKTEEEQSIFVQKFFCQAGKVLKKRGILVIYTNEKKYIKSNLTNYGSFQLLEEYEINKKEGTYVYVIRSN